MALPRTETLDQLVSHAAAEVPDRLAVIADGESLTFAEFDARIGAVAAWLTESTAPHARVAVIADNGVDYATLYYAAPRAGRVLVLINQRLGTGEQQGQLALASAELIVGEPRFLDALGPDVAGRHVSLDGVEWQRAREHSPRLAASSGDPDDAAWMLFTSGSTGTPKPIVHSHRSVLTAVRGTVAGRSVRVGGVYLLPFPMCHVAGYNMLVHHAKQSTVLPVARFRPETFVASVAQHGVTSCSLAPTMLHGLLAYLDETEGSLPSLREIAYGSAAIPADLLGRAIQRLDVDFHQGYGMTETGGNVTFLGPAEHRAGAAGDAAVLASAGHPHAEVEVRIDERSGEILVRGAQVAPGLADGQGWFGTGDVGRIDRHGRLIVVDRIKDVIISGGENVSSREVEDVLSSNPGVDVVAVVGVPDEYWGEAVCAVVVATAGHSPSAEDLIAHVRAQLAGFKRPRHVLFVSALPETSNGKIAKARVRELARAALRA